MITTEKIMTKEDFISFLKEFIIEFKKNGQNWENNDLMKYLVAIQSYTEDIDGYYKNMNDPSIDAHSNWRIFADILVGASMYE